MSKSKIFARMEPLIRACSKHSPEILVGFGIAGVLTTVIFSVTATKKAVEKVQTETEKKGEQLTKQEIVKATWTFYIPTAVSGITTVGCIIGANSIHLRRHAALAAAYTISETALREYRDKVVETIGEKKEQSIRDSVAKERLEKDPVQNREILMTGKGETLCYDLWSGRYFKSDIDKLRKAEIQLNRQMISEMSVSLNEFYYAIGLPEIRIGNDIGWNIAKDLIEIEFSSQLTEDGTPCLTIGFTKPPVYEFYTL